MSGYQSKDLVESAIERFEDNTTSEAIIESTGLTKKRALRAGLRSLSLNQFVVFSVHNESNNRFFVGIERVIEFVNSDVLGNVLKKSEIMNADMRQYGFGSFNLSVEGAFPDAKRGNLFKEHVVNLKLAEGKVTYNVEAYDSNYPRTITFEINKDEFDYLVKFCTAKKIIIGQLMRKITKEFISKFKKVKRPIHSWRKSRKKS